MANSAYEIREVRFVIEPELTQAYVRIQQTDHDMLPGVTGWHHKTFPASTSLLDIMNAWSQGKEQPLMWPLNAPTK